MQELFKGYVITKNKMSTMKFKDVESNKLLTLDNANHYDEYAGILEDNVILVDIDNMDQSELLADIVEELQLNCKIISTKKGRHFYFMNDKHKVKKNFTGVKLACGITADIKIGNRTSYSVLKYDKKLRFVEYDIEDDESYDELPSWLRPTDFNYDLIGLCEGDGRNDILYKCKLTLLKKKFNKNEVFDTLELINKFIFAEPLNNAELEKVAREQQLHDDENSTSGYYFSSFGDMMMEEEEIKVINGILHIYDDGVYESNKKFIFKRMMKYKKIPHASREEVYKYMEIMNLEESKRAPAKFICFKNGILDIEKDLLLPHSSDIILTNKIPHNFNINAYDESVDTVLNNISCGDIEIRMLIEEMSGYCMFTRNELRKGFILKGNKSNGKSTYLNILKGMIGEKNFSSLDLNELDDRFKPSQLVGKIANFGDDIEDDYIRNTATLKKLISGDTVTVENKGVDAYKFNCTAKFIFSANTIPRINDKTGAVMDRLIIVPFNANFNNNKKDFDPYIIDNLDTESAYEYMILLGIKGLKRVLQNQRFTTGEKVTEAIHEYNINNNPILLFFEEITDVANKKTKDVYNAYRIFCQQNNFTELAENTFTRECNRHFKCTTERRTINGHRFKYFIKVQ